MSQKMKPAVCCWAEATLALHDKRLFYLQNATTQTQQCDIKYTKREIGPDYGKLQLALLPKTRVSVPGTVQTTAHVTM